VDWLGARKAQWVEVSILRLDPAGAIFVQADSDKMSNPETVRYNRFLSQSNNEDAACGFAPAVAGRQVMVTGAGGYIGSALAMALAAAGPARLVLLDSSEHNLFKVQQRLEAACCRIPHEAVLGSVTDADLLNRLFSRIRPSIVYHAAALKHVPPLEFNPLAAVHNNSLGTYTLAQAALRHGVSALVLVSTDKAVNPHSIMGASKRLAELTMAALSGPPCRMNTVRLGNVIGSTGSVIPIFREQIARRGPVTVTDPEVTRYFMSLAEAVQAILAAGMTECEGRILLPALGEPESIADLARFLIAAGADSSANEIPLQFIGLRPGEKIKEDLIFSTETRDGFTGQLEVIRTPSPASADLHARMAQLACHVASGDVAEPIATVSAMVPEYQPSSLIVSAIAACGSVGR
jgi:FlaA1/EpsC-like NDP-sugar epimerase